MTMATPKSRRELLQIQRERRYFFDARQRHIRDIVGALLFMLFFTLFQVLEARADALVDVHLPEPITVEGC